MFTVVKPHTEEGKELASMYTKVSRKWEHPLSVSRTASLVRIIPTMSKITQSREDYTGLERSPSVKTASRYVSIWTPSSLYLPSCASRSPHNYAGRQNYSPATFIPAVATSQPICLGKETALGVDNRLREAEFPCQANPSSPGRLSEQTIPHQTLPGKAIHTHFTQT